MLLHCCQQHSSSGGGGQARQHHKQGVEPAGNDVDKQAVEEAVRPRITRTVVTGHQLPI